MRLYRPVGQKELALIRDSGWRAFPPRLPEQLIFYRLSTMNILIKSPQSGTRRMMLSHSLSNLRKRVVNKTKIFSCTSKTPVSNLLCTITF